MHYIKVKNTNVGMQVTKRKKEQFGLCGAEMNLGK